MNEEERRPWYKKKRYIFTISTFAILAMLGGNSSSKTTPTPQVQNYSNTATYKSTTPVTPTYKATNTVTPTQTYSTLSNDNYYTNIYGNEVHSPAYSNSVPAGASAKCRDGKYSFSQSRRGTCSHHGGVSRWL